MDKAVTYFTGKVYNVGVKETLRGIVISAERDPNFVIVDSGGIYRRVHVDAILSEVEC